MITNFCCDLLKNIYLCGINNNSFFPSDCSKLVVICLKISIFVVSTTTEIRIKVIMAGLWFAWKYLSLWYQQQPIDNPNRGPLCCDLLENIYLCGINNNMFNGERYWMQLWFAWKYLPLWYQQQLRTNCCTNIIGCDLLENIYLCGINNNADYSNADHTFVVICLKISTSVVSTTTACISFILDYLLWFAWKYLPLRYQQQRLPTINSIHISCDLLENIYLCGINNNLEANDVIQRPVVICLKISTFAVSTTTNITILHNTNCCDLLENIYLCGINNNYQNINRMFRCVVICLKISTFAVSTTTYSLDGTSSKPLWFAWKYLPLRYQQQPCCLYWTPISRCDLLENIYLCGINNNFNGYFIVFEGVVICLKISTFAVSTTTSLIQGLTAQSVVICLKISTFAVSTTTHSL